MYFTKKAANMISPPGGQRHGRDPRRGRDQLLREPSRGHLVHRVHAPRRPLQLPLQLADLRLAQEVSVMQVGPTFQLAEHSFNVPFQDGIEFKQF